MSDKALKIALTFTAIDAASGVLRGMENKILGMGRAAQQVRKDFEGMVSNAQAGLKSLTASYATFNMLKPGMKIAANLQESMTNMEMSLRRAGENAESFHAAMEKIRGTAGKLQLLFPFGQKEMIDAANILARSGMRRENLSDPKGALYSVGALASIGNIPTVVAAREMAQIGAMYNLKGGELGKMADWMQKIGTTTLLPIEEMGLALSEGGQMAKAYHIGAKDTLTALAALRAEAGSASKAGDELQEFLTRLPGVGKQAKKAMDEAGLSFFDKKGSFVGIEKLMMILQNWEKSPKMQALTEKDRLDLREKIFGLRGQRGEMTFAGIGDNSFKAIKDRAEKSLNIEDKVAMSLEDVNKQAQALTGSIQTLIADGFNPMLKGITSVMKAINAQVGSLDDFATQHQKLMGVADYTVAGAGGAGALYGLYRLFKAGGFGSRVLRGLGGAGSTALGVAEGKILEKTAGIMPVFVTNWPSGGVGAGAADILASGKKGGLLDYLGRPLEVAGAGGVAAGVRAAAPAVAGTIASAVGVAVGAVVAPFLGLVALDQVLDSYGMKGKSALWTDIKERGGPVASWTDMGGQKGPVARLADEVGKAEGPVVSWAAEVGKAIGPIHRLADEAGKATGSIVRWTNEVGKAADKGGKAGRPTYEQVMRELQAGRRNNIAFNSDLRKTLDRHHVTADHLVGRRPRVAEVMNALHGRHLQVEDHHLDAVLHKLNATLSRERKNEIHLNIRVDQSGRVTSQTNDPNTTTRINLKRGNFDFGPEVDSP